MSRKRQLNEPAPSLSDGRPGPPPSRVSGELPRVEGAEACASTSEKESASNSYPPQDSSARPIVPRSSVSPIPEPRHAELDLQPGELPRSWTCRLLSLVVETHAQTDEVAVEVLLDVLASLAPDCGVGACIIGEDGAALTARRSKILDSRLDPSRLFPEFAHEHVVPIPDFPGSTLHLATSSAPAVRPGARHHRLGEEAARVLRRLLLSARQAARIRRDDERTRTLTSQMVQAEKLASFGQVAAELVHELNNPLTSIVAYTAFLKRRWKAREGVREDELERLDRIGASAERVLKFTRDLVGYARPANPQRVPVVVHAVVDQAILFCEHLFSGGSLTIERIFGDGILPVSGSPEELTQVFVNLLTNAAHATARSSGKRVRITIERTPSDEAKLVVADDGPGIDEAFLGRVFDPFFTTKPKGEGTGLGLAIVKTIVEAHGGRVWAESLSRDGDGGERNGGPRGARFVVVLPIARGGVGS